MYVLVTSMPHKGTMELRSRSMGGKTGVLMSAGCGGEDDGDDEG